MAVNQAVLIGRLVRDPELRHTPSGEAVCSLRLAVDGAGQGKSYDEYKGREVQNPGFFGVDVWGTQAENCAQYLAKGREVAVVGALKFREWEAQDGTKRQAVEIRAFTVQFIGGRGDDTDSQGSFGGGGSPDFQPAAASTAAAPPDDDPFSRADDDIPF